LATSGAAFATPTPFNSLLWRIVAVGENAHWEGFYTVGSGRPIAFTRYRHRPGLLDGVADFEELEHAVAAAHRAAHAEAERLALAAGAGAVDITVERSDLTATASDGSDIFVECHVTGIAVGRPRTAAAM
jgi:hypothetical protein